MGTCQVLSLFNKSLQPHIHKINAFRFAAIAECSLVLRMECIDSLSEAPIKPNGQLIGLPCVAEVAKAAQLLHIGREAFRSKQVPSTTLQPAKGHFNFTRHQICHASECILG
jgi:hypothetical protein